MNIFFFVLEHRYPGGRPTQCDKRHSIKEERGRHNENASVSEREGKLRVDSVYLYYILYKTSNMMSKESQVMSTCLILCDMV